MSDLRGQRRATGAPRSPDTRLLTTRHSPQAGLEGYQLRESEPMSASQDRRSACPSSSIDALRTGAVPSLFLVIGHLPSATRGHLRSQFARVHRQVHPNEASSTGRLDSCAEPSVLAGDAIDQRSDSFHIYRHLVPRFEEERRNSSVADSGRCAGRDDVTRLECEGGTDECN